MDRPVSPLTRQTVIGFLGFNLTFGGLLGWIANLIQVLTVKNGLLILFGLSVISVSIFVFVFIKYLHAAINYIENEKKFLEAESERQLEIANTLARDLQGRLDKLLIEFRSRSSLNPHPIKLNALVCTKRLELAEKPLVFGVKDITRKLIVIDKGAVHGLTYGMAFAIHKMGQNSCLEVCGVDRIESHSSWLSHSGTAVSLGTDPEELDVRLVYPQEVQDSERELAELLLMAEGYSKTRMF